MLNRLQRSSLIIGLINRLKKKGSWCGETHIQKSIYFLQALTEVPMEFDFIIYKHGPFSFDLRDELTAMRADGLIENIARPAPYGPSLSPTESGNQIHGFFPKTTQKYDMQLYFTAEHLGDKSVAELERMGTALYISMKNKKKGRKERAEEIHKLKPHVQVEDACDAVKKVEEMQESFTSFD